MDPNEALSNMLGLAETVVENLGGEETATAQELAEQVIVLHEWITRGGFLPDEWKR